MLDCVERIIIESAKVPYGNDHQKCHARLGVKEEKESRPNNWKSIKLNLLYKSVDTLAFIIAKWDRAPIKMSNAPTLTRLVHGLTSVPKGGLPATTDGLRGCDFESARRVEKEAG